VICVLCCNAAMRMRARITGFHAEGVEFDGFTKSWQQVRENCGCFSLEMLTRVTVLESIHLFSLISCYKNKDNERSTVIEPNA